MFNQFVFIVFVFAAFTSASLPAQVPAVDGIYDEWTHCDQVATDSAGDGQGAFDISFVCANTQGSVLYLYFDIGQRINLQNGPEEAGTLKLMPLDIIKAAGVTDVHCAAVDGSAYTWRGLEPEESFWPGRLDLVSVFGLDDVVEGRVFDSSRLHEAVLRELGIESSDSRASDHLMLVVDCRLEE